MLIFGTKANVYNYRAQMFFVCLFVFTRFASPKDFLADRGLWTG